MEKQQKQQHFGQQPMQEFPTYLHEHQNQLEQKFLHPNPTVQGASASTGSFLFGQQTPFSQREPLQLLHSLRNTWNQRPAVIAQNAPPQPEYTMATSSPSVVLSKQNSDLKMVIQHQPEAQNKQWSPRWSGQSSRASICEENWAQKRQKQQSDAIQDKTSLLKQEVPTSVQHSQIKPHYGSVYEPGTCARRLSYIIKQMQTRPQV